VLFGDLVDGGRVNVSIVDDDLTFEISPILTKEQKRASKKETPIVEVLQDDVENKIQQ